MCISHWQGQKDLSPILYHFPLHCVQGTQSSAIVCPSPGLPGLTWATRSVPTEAREKIIYWKLDLTAWAIHPPPTFENIGKTLISPKLQPENEPPTHPSISPQESNKVIRFNKALGGYYQCNLIAERQWEGKWETEPGAVGHKLIVPPTGHLSCHAHARGGQETQLSSLTYVALPPAKFLCFALLTPAPKNLLQEQLYCKSLPHVHVCGLDYAPSNVFSWPCLCTSCLSQLLCLSLHYPGGSRSCREGRRQYRFGLLSLLNYTAL